jgi:hypothetical protein
MDTLERGFIFARYNINNVCWNRGALGVEITNEPQPLIGIVCWVNGPDGSSEVGDTISPE